MNPLNNLLNEMQDTPALDALAEAVTERCDKCDAELTESDRELGQEFTNGQVWCQKCWEQSQDYLNDAE